MKIEKFEDWHKDQDTYCQGLTYAAWEHQQTKIDLILEYISLIGHQKELDHFLKTEKGWKE